MRGRWRRGIALLPVLGLVFFLSACGPAQRPEERESSREQESRMKTVPQPPVPGESSREQTTTEDIKEEASRKEPGEASSPESSEESSEEPSSPPDTPKGPETSAATREPEEMGTRRSEILRGEILALNGGRPVGEDYGGFRIDLDGSSGEELITLEPDLLYGERPVFRLLIEGRPAGTPLSPELKKNASWKELLAWPDESVFSREEEAKLYLASPDGEGIVLFLERAGETYGLIPEKGEEGLRLRTRFRGPGKSMEDFIPRQGLKEYIAQGWLVRPGNQDRLDLTGDGEEETILVRPEEGDALIPFGEIISAREMPEEARIVFEGFSSGGSPIYFRYGNLYYAPNSQGGYDLMAELLVQGELRRVCYQLMDFNARPLVRGDSFAHASYRAAGFVSGPAPGWEGVSEAARKVYEEERQGKTPIDPRELGELRQFFSSLFAAHFLLDEYEDVRDIPLEHLFY
ncbi:MAG: hypothetical protein J6H18_00705, partial [Lachnospiraceae bacterium]|nr:hypothetical protein [Lachnospiraceae bacterium]